MDEFRAELLAAFAGELAEHLAAIRASLADADAGRPVDLREFSRRTHSLKGAARAVELPATEAAAHAAEAVVLAVEAGDRTLDAATIEELKGLTDAIEDGARPDDPATEPISPSPPPERVQIGGKHIERLSRSLMALSGEVAEQAAIGEDLAALSAELSAIAATLAKTGDGEADRRLRRGIATLERIRRTTRAAGHAMDQAIATLESDAERIMLQPVATLFEGHERMVRELAISQGKVAILQVEQVEGEADRRVLAALREPLLHLLRNAVGHGIEPPSVRQRAGKPDAGTIRIEPRIVRGRLIVTVSDDGAGLNAARIEARARAAGLIGQNAPAPAAAALHAMVFEPGFSTADRVDELAGRGIGLSIVAEAARRLHGHVTINPGTDGGTRVRLSVPLSLTRQTVLMVEAGGSRWGIPASAVDRVLQVDSTTLDHSAGRPLLRVDGAAIPVVSLADLLGVAGGDRGDRQSAVLLATDAGRRILLVDAHADVQALLVGDPTAIAGDVPMIYGTVTTQSGVVLLLSPDRLITDEPRGTVAPAPSQPAVSERRTILVVDDSITTRTLERSILEAQGYRVLVDVDGLAALERLRSGIDRIDLMVADVEMPRMDGFGLLSAVRNDPALETLPVIMMTSRNSPDDVERGLSLGANAYVTKQEFDSGTLVATVQQLI